MFYSHLPGNVVDLGVIGYGWQSNYSAGRTAHNVLEADKSAVQYIEDRFD